VIAPADILDYDGVAARDGFREDLELLFGVVFAVRSPVNEDGIFAGAGWAHNVGAQHGAVTHRHGDVALQAEVRSRDVFLLGTREDGNEEYRKETANPHIRRE
jgi:hypothetical protein